MSQDKRLHTATALAGKMPALLLHAEKIAHTVMRGAHGRRRTGQGETFWQFRHYQQGDSSRDIDWRQTAKRDDGRNDAFVREREWEAAQTLYLYRDASASMDFASRSGTPTKKEYAETILLALGIITLHGGEQVGLLGTDLAPQAHDSAIGRIFEYLPQQKEMAETGRRISSRSSVVLIGDFYRPVADTAAFVNGLAARGVSGLMLQVCDVAEETMPYTGRMKFVDSENPSDDVTIPQVEAVRDEYLKRFSAHREALSTATQAAGWRFMHCTTAQKPETVLYDIYHALAARGGER
jgi:uncharacterized protein (DUF58 family)